MKNKKVIFIAESNSKIKLNLFRYLSSLGYPVITASSTPEIYSLSKNNKNIGLLLLSLNLPEDQNINLIKNLRSSNTELKSILLNDPSETFTDLSSQHFSYILNKPIHIEMLHQYIENINSLPENDPNISRYEGGITNFENILGCSHEITNVLDLIKKVAASNSTILITGESGTGKELVARAIHLHSLRTNFPFIPINCGAIPSELLESELFGHTKGAFTNALANRIGRFELAKNGTIFFDEIGDMSLHLQVKLLRVLQEKNFEPIGSTKTIESNVRVITATNINLEEAVAKGKFREDLFYRLNVIPIHIPPLKQRPGDIPILLKHFMEKFNQLSSKKTTGITPDALHALSKYPWPGNIRELENLIERITILKGGGLIDMQDLPPKYHLQSLQSPLPPSSIEIPQMGVDFKSAVDQYENTLIMKALEQTGWNRNQAAILLKMNRTTLVEKIKKKGLRPPENLNPNLNPNLNSSSNRTVEDS